VALESKFKRDVREEIEALFPGCIIIKGNSSEVQGIPDMLVIWHERYAFLEFKRSANEIHQPNQDWYVGLLDEWSFAAFIYPENKEEILDALQLSFSSRRKTRVPQR